MKRLTKTFAKVNEEDVYDFAAVSQKRGIRIKAGHGVRALTKSTCTDLFSVIAFNLIFSKVLHFILDSAITVHYYHRRDSMLRIFRRGKRIFTRS